MDRGVSRTPIVSRRPVVLFVGSFPASSAGPYWGGQAYACRALLESPLREMVDFVLFDTTAAAEGHRPFYKRLVVGCKRLVCFVGRIVRHRPQVVLLFSSYGWSFVEKGLMAVMARWSGARVVFAPRSGHLVDDVHRSAIFRWYARAVFARCQVVVCQAQYWKRFFMEHLGVEGRKAQVIPNFVAELPKWNVARLMPSAEIEIFFLGSVVRAKGVYEIVEAAARLEDLPLTWHIAGAGRDLDGIRRRVAGDAVLGQKVRLHGWVWGKQKEALLKRCQVFLLPSYREGLPNSLLEAMSWGLVPITTAVGAIPEVVADGQNGLLVRPGDIDGIVRALKGLAEDRDALYRLRLAARKTVAEKFVVSKVLPLWRSALGISG